MTRKKKPKKIVISAAARKQFEKENQEAFAEMRAVWRRQSLAELEGDLSLIAMVRDRYVPKRQRKRFDQMVEETGIGDHPAFLMLLHNIAISGGY